MSTGTYYTCDMCGRIEMKGNAKWGWFHSGLWVDREVEQEGEQ